MSSAERSQPPKAALLSLAAMASTTAIAVVALGDLRPFGWHLAIAGGALLIPLLLCGRALWQWRDGAEQFWRPVLLFAVALRLLVLVGATPSLSDDVYRYVWDGWQQQHGVNPYLHAPESEEVAELRDALWGHVNHKHVPTIYPPLAEAVFFAADVVSHSERAQRAMFVLFDVALILVLARLCRARGVPLARTALYALHPLPILEIAGQGHNDSLPLFWLVAALLLHVRGNGAASLLLLAASTVSKFFGGAVAPLIALRHSPRVWLVFPLAILCAYVPYMSAGRALFNGLGTYAAHWEFNHGAFRVAVFLLHELGVADPRTLVKGAFAIIGAAVLLVLCWRRTDPVPGAVVLIAVAMLMSPTVHPWYVLWCLVLLPCVQSYGLLAWSMTVVLSYHVMPRFVSTDVWREDLWFVALEYVPVFALLAFDAWRYTTTRSASERAPVADPSTSES